ncbi:hypothetical protein RDABS01_036328 [Bienertia sinuspersici]
MDINLKPNSIKMAEKKAKSGTVNGDNLSGDVSHKTLEFVDHLITEEILPRLPVKSLIRFKLVCKRWNSTISSSEFVKLHLKFSSLNNQNRHFIIYPDDEKFYGKQNLDSYGLLPYRECSNIRDLVWVDGGVGDVDWYHIVGSSNGLVCLYQRDDDEDERHCFFTLWNPATGEDRDISSPDGVHVSEAHGFGYVPSLDDYLIVACFGSGTVDGSTFRGFYVFSVKVGKWERIFGCFHYLQTSRWRWKWKRVRARADEECIAKELERQAVLVGDTMYWASEFFVGKKSIVGFHVVTKELNWQCGYWSLELFQVKGCLSLFGYRKNDVSDFWTLKNPNDWSSWQKILSVDINVVPLITFSETGKCLVRQSKEFKLVDPCKEALECTKGNGAEFRRRLVIRDHVESLISPLGITKSDEKEVNSGNSNYLATNSMLLENKG